MIMKTIKVIIMLYFYTKKAIIKTIKMIAIKLKMKRTRGKPIKIDQIDNVLDRSVFVCLNWSFPNRYTCPVLTLFDTQLLPNLKQKNSLN